MGETKTAVGAPEIPVQLTKPRSRKWVPKVTGVITEDLYDRYEIPQRDHRNRRGYQRELSTTRVNRLAKELREDRVDLPTSILVNMRNFDENRHLPLIDDQLHLRLEGEPLHVVDGQHRVAALGRLFEEDRARWGISRSPSCACSGRTNLRRCASFT